MFRLGLARASTLRGVKSGAARFVPLSIPAGLHGAITGLGSVRFKSTIIEEIAAIAPSNNGGVQEIVEVVQEVVPPGQVGYFESLGLAQSWVWPSGFFQHIFEITHVYTGLPWWATILAVTIGLRALMMPLYISASDASARMARIKPELAKIMEQTKVATEQIEIQKAMLARKQLMKESGVKITNIIKPIAAVPIFLGVFGALSGMCQAQVAGMATEGLFWFQNLTLPDPYCGLQIITACLYALTFKLFGGETGATTLSPMMKKLFTYMPFVAVPLTMSLPAAVCFYFAINSVISIIQSNLLKSPTVRNALGLAPMLTPAEQKSIDSQVEKAQSDSIFGALRQKFDDAKEQAEKKLDQQERDKKRAAEREIIDQNRYVQIKSKKQ